MGPMQNRDRRKVGLLTRIVKQWGAPERPPLLGVIWMAVLLGALVWLDDKHGGIFLVPPFAATMSILLYLPGVSIAQPFAVVCGLVISAAIGTAMNAWLGPGPLVSIVAAIAALIVLPLLHCFHPPGVALAMCPPLFHLGPWFALVVALPFALAAVISCALISRLLRSGMPYPAPLEARTGADPIEAKASGQGG